MNISNFADIENTYEQLIFYNGNTWLTNFNNEQLPIYEKAISIYGDNSLFIVNNGKELLS